MLIYTVALIFRGFTDYQNKLIKEMLEEQRITIIMSILIKIESDPATKSCFRSIFKEMV